ncbi:MAG TPA: ABC transporter substrate-binding protein, partial [Acidimicrobiales bacterium]|nr:ABC transporter substrate-binding protein [Acidimicrobiales bacterium]
PLTVAVARPPLRLGGGDQGFPSPFAYRRGPGYVQMSYLYDTLLWKDSTGEVLPWLAASLPRRSPDGLTYTFQLRENIRWHDGRPLTPEDVAFSFEYFASQRSSGRLSQQIIVEPVPEITEVRPTGPRSVDFRLNAPVATFLQFGGAGAVPIVPRHVWSQIDNASQASDPAVLVGSGPYRLESYSAGEGTYLYTANDDYFLGRPFVRRLENRPVGEGPAGELTALQAGELDAANASGIRPEALESFRREPAFEILEQPPGVSQTALNWNLGAGGALADVRFRQACCRAINRSDLVQRLFGGNGTPGNPGWIPPESPWHVRVEQYPFDVAAANRLLDDAGYRRPSPDAIRQTADGQPLRFTLLATTPPSPIAEVVVSSLRTVGIELQTQAIDTPAFNQRVNRGETEMYLIGAGGMNSDLAPDYLRLIYNSKSNLTQRARGYRDAQVDELTEQQLHTLDEDERKRIVGRIQELVARDVPLLPLVYPSSFAITRKSTFDQWYITPGGVAGVIPTIYNKHVFLTGRKEGFQIRPIQE